jgi:hypothetical protein
MITPMSARIAASVSSEIDGDVSPGIDPDGMDVSGASVVVVASVGVVVPSEGLVDVCVLSPEESQAPNARVIASTMATIDVVLRDEETFNTAGRVTGQPNKREHRPHTETPCP